MPNTQTESSQQASEQLRKFYQSFSGEGAKPLTPDNPYCVPILGETPEKDPIISLWQRIDFAESESVNLLTGFRGNGKSTELLRLKVQLEESGCIVFLINMLDYLLMTKPVELSDFTLSLMAAIAGEAEKREDFDLKPLTQTYWERLTTFLESDVKVDKLGMKVGPKFASADLGLKLKTEPDFKLRLQEHLRGHLTRLVEDAREFIDRLVVEIRKQLNDPNKKVVLLVDSVEQIRGQGEDAQKVHSSVVELFSGQAANLAYPKLHTVYTIPPFLMALSQNLGRNLGGHPITQWPNVHVRVKETDEPDTGGIDVMKRIVSHRYAQWETFFTSDQITELAFISGGDLRDFFRLLRECLLACRIGLSSGKTKVDQQIIKRVVRQLLNEMLPIADKDASWLAAIHASKQEELPSVEELPVLARYLDGNLIMNYLNGEPWYDIHPVLIGEITRRIAEMKSSAKK